MLAGDKDCKRGLMSESVKPRNVLPRRRLLRGAVSGLATIAVGSIARPAAARPYDGPNVIIVRFGGGVRRRDDRAGAYP
jgi:hypothetical protein